MSAVFHAAAPVRLDFAGGWTDVPPFSAREGGLVVSAALELLAQAEVRPGGERFRLVSEDLHDQLELEADELRRDGRLDLLKAGLRMMGSAPCTLTTRSEAPAGSGLGSSGALDVALIAALSRARGLRLSTREIADRACHLEAVEAAVPGGRQDQFTAAYGGFLRLSFRDPDASVEPLQLESELASCLERRIILVYTGASRFSGATIGRVMRAYEQGEPRVVAALHGIRAVAERMADALRAGDLARIGELLTENWRHQQALDSAMCTQEMAALERLMRGAGVLGGKAAGAGAGGCMFFLGPEDPTPALNAARSMGARPLPVRWAREGVRAW